MAIFKWDWASLGRCWAEYASFQVREIRFVKGNVSSSTACTKESSRKRVVQEAVEQDVSFIYHALFWTMLSHRTLKESEQDKCQGSTHLGCSKDQCNFDFNTLYLYSFIETIQYLVYRPPNFPSPQSLSNDYTVILVPKIWIKSRNWARSTSAESSGTSRWGGTLGCTQQYWMWAWRRGRKFASEW